MKHKTAITEIRRMTPQELRKDLQVKRAEAAKMRIGLEMQSEKNSGLYRAHKREIARMTMVLTEMEKNPSTAKAPTKAIATETPAKASQSAKKSVKGTGSKKKKSA
jgi:ribosomal protein L29